MSKTQSQGIGYFPMAVDFFSDRKIKILNARYGNTHSKEGGVISNAAPNEEGA